MNAVATQAPVAVRKVKRTLLEAQRTTDPQLQQECEEVLKKDTYSSHLRTVKVTAYADGHIVLTGMVDEYFKKQVAIPAFRFTASVKSIDDQIVVVTK